MDLTEITLVDLTEFAVIALFTYHITGIMDFQNIFDGTSLIPLKGGGH